MLKVSSKLNLDDVQDEVTRLLDIIKAYGCGRIAIPVTRNDEVLPNLYIGDWFVPQYIIFFLHTTAFTVYELKN